MLDLFEIDNFSESIVDVIGDIMGSYFSKITSGEIINKKVITKAIE